MMRVKHESPQVVREALRMLEAERSESTMPTHRLIDSLIRTAVLHDKRQGSLQHRVMKAHVRPRSSPAARLGDRSQWVQLSPRGIIPEKMAQMEALLRQREERETALAARLATLERQMGMSAPMPPSPEKKDEGSLSLLVSG